MAAQLPRPFSFSTTLSDEDVLRGIEMMTDFYNWQQRKADPAWVDVTPQAYLRERLKGWLRREHRMKNPITSEDPEVMRWAYDTKGA
jgi:hypothetical protein